MDRLTFRSWQSSIIMIKALMNSARQMNAWFCPDVFMDVRGAFHRRGPSEDKCAKGINALESCRQLQYCLVRALVGLSAQSIPICNVV